MPTVYDPRHYVPVPAPRIEIPGLCSPGDPPPWPPPFPLLPPVSPSRRRAGVQRCAVTQRGGGDHGCTEIYRDRRQALRDLLQRRREQLAAVAKIEQPVLFELKEDCRPPLRAHR